MTRKHIRYEVGTFLPCTREEGFGPYKSLGEATWSDENNQGGSIAYFHALHPYGCTIQEPGVIFFVAFQAKNPVDAYHELSGLLLPVRCWFNGVAPDEEDENAWKEYNEKYRFEGDYFLEQTYRVDRNRNDIEINRHGPSKNLIIGIKEFRGVKTLSIFLFDEPDEEGRFAKLSLVRFPGHYIEDEAEQRNFIGHFLKHWWRLKPDTGSPFIFHKQKDGQWTNLTFDTMPDDIR